MKQEHAKDVYALFEKFAETFIYYGNSILSDHSSVLTSESLANCFKCYVEDYKEGSDSFDSKIIEQFKDADINTKLVFAHAEWLWVFAVMDKTQWRKKEYTKRTTGLMVEELKQDVYPKGFGNAGQWHNQNKYHEIKFILLIIRFLKRKIDDGELSDVGEISEWVEKLALYQKYNEDHEDFDIPEELKNDIPSQKLAVCNILTYVAFPDNYERIASDAHKWQIFSSFSGLLSKEEKEDEGSNRDEKIKLIRDHLTEFSGNPNFDFYDEEYSRVWNYSLTQEGFSEVQGLQYKKAIILYGPPGTSKTFTAKRLAYALIANSYLRKKENVANYFKSKEDFTEGRIHRLQLHTNYNYEDFVVGIQLDNHATKAVKGKLFDICEAAEKDKTNEMPHVLILDEINRVDLSRLFGEVFSALENREEAIDLSIGKLKLTIPSNLYVIGTMNEIDFSLERIDFALRRRFLWFFYGFDRSTLNSMIWHKNKTLDTRLSNDEVERFINNAHALNNEIIQLPELGEQYQVGHTFFAEVVEIYKSYKDLNGYTNRIKNKIFRNGGAANILWDISIQPILSAFLGNLDRESKTDKLNELRKVFIQ
jgi:5-methylcytosine-specific restriction enzyme B